MVQDNDQDRIIGVTDFPFNDHRPLFVVLCLFVVGTQVYGLSEGVQPSVLTMVMAPLLIFLTWLQFLRAKNNVFAIREDHLEVWDKFKVRSIPYKNIQRAEIANATKLFYKDEQGKPSELTILRGNVRAAVRQQAIPALEECLLENDIKVMIK